MENGVLYTSDTYKSEVIIRDITFNKYNRFSQFTPLEKAQTISFVIWIIILIFTFYRTNKSKKKYLAMQKQVTSLQQLRNEHNR